VQADSPLASATSTLRATRHGDSSVGTGLHALYGEASGPVPLRYRRAQSDLGNLFLSVHLAYISKYLSSSINKKCLQA
jgi:hypothetical protein